ncbi:MAG: hypothetical protein M3164_00675 [Actinomycetota bacterium]|nr:hypothetical protein [Actinomycetota bacterium]
MGDATFTCNDCGRVFPRREMKEFFDESGQKLELCAEDLDKRMNAAGVVEGGPGEEKQAAAYAEGAPQEGPYGERPSPTQS